MLKAVIRKAIETAGSDSLDVFGGVWEGGYSIQQDPEEFAELVALLAAFGPFPFGLEIGIAAGGTTRFIREEIGVETLLVIDDGQHVKYRIWQEINRRAIEQQLREYCGDSHSAAAAEWVSEALAGNPLDYVGIDADHSYQGVLQDWNLVLPHLRSGSIVWFHDLRSCAGVTQAWETILSRYRVTQLLTTKGRHGTGVLRFGS